MSTAHVAAAQALSLDATSRRSFLATGSLTLASVAATGMLPVFAQDAQTQALLGVAAQQLPAIPAIKRSVIIDTDPGQDDAIAVLFALAAPERLDVRALTVSVGNMPLSITEKNARRVRDWAGRTDVPVYAGYPRPLIREPIFADDVHGKTGLDGPMLHEPRGPLSQGHAVDYLIKTLRSAEAGSVVLVGLGPLTNIAAALNMAPDIKPAISEVVVLGGAWGVGGNITPAATFNLYADPEAASVVFRSGVPVTAVSHDAARRVLVTPERIEPFRRLGNTAGKVVANILDSAMDFAMRRRGVKVGPMYDPCVIAYLLQPELFKGARVPVDIETRGEFTAGATVVDFRGYTKRKANTLWINSVDIDGFYGLLEQHIARLP